VEQLDVDRLELALTTLRSERDNLARQREIVVDALKFAMGMSVAEKITLGDNTDRLMAQYADADLTSAMNYMNRPEYLNLLKGRELSQLNVQLNEKTWLPNVVGFLQWQGNTQGGLVFYSIHRGRHQTHFYALRQRCEQGKTPEGHHCVTNRGRAEKTPRKRLYARTRSGTQAVHERTRARGEPTKKPRFGTKNLQYHPDQIQGRRRQQFRGGAGRAGRLFGPAERDERTLRLVEGACRYSESTWTKLIR
jgi:hypothetical protein